MHVVKPKTQLTNANHDTLAFLWQARLSRRALPSTASKAGVTEPSKASQFKVCAAVAASFAASSPEIDCATLRAIPCFMMQCMAMYCTSCRFDPDGT